MNRLENLDIHEFLASLGKRAVTMANQGYSCTQSKRSKCSDVVFVEDTDEYAQLSSISAFTAREESGFSRGGGWKARDSAEPKNKDILLTRQNRAQASNNFGWGENKEETQAGGWQENNSVDANFGWEEEKGPVNGWDKGRQEIRSDGWGDGMKETSGGWGQCTDMNAAGDSGWGKEQEKETIKAGICNGRVSEKQRENEGSRSGFSGWDGWNQGIQEEGISQGWQGSGSKGIKSVRREEKNPPGKYGRDSQEEGAQNDSDWGEAKTATGGGWKEDKVVDSGGWESVPGHESAETSLHQEKHNGWGDDTKAAGELGVDNQVPVPTGWEGAPKGASVDVWGKKPSQQMANGWGEDKGASNGWGKRVNNGQDGGQGEDKNPPSGWETCNQKAERTEDGWGGSIDEGNNGGWGGSKGSNGWKKTMDVSFSDRMDRDAPNGQNKSILGKPGGDLEQKKVFSKGRGSHFQQESSNGWGEDKNCSAGWVKTTQVSDSKGWESGALEEGAPNGWGSSSNADKGFSGGVRKSGNWGQDCQTKDVSASAHSRAPKNTNGGWGKEHCGPSDGWRGETKATSGRWGRGNQNFTSGEGGRKKNFGPGRWKSDTSKESPQASGGWAQDNDSGWGQRTKASTNGWGQSSQQNNDKWGSGIHVKTDLDQGKDGQRWKERETTGNGWENNDQGKDGQRWKERETTGNGWENNEQKKINDGWGEKQRVAVHDGWETSGHEDDQGKDGQRWKERETTGNGWENNEHKKINDGWGEKQRVAVHDGWETSAHEDVGCGWGTAENNIDAAVRENVAVNISKSEGERSELGDETHTKHASFGWGNKSEASLGKSRSIGDIVYTSQEKNKEVKAQNKSVESDKAKDDAGGGWEESTSQKAVAGWEDSTSQKAVAGWEGIDDDGRQMRKKKDVDSGWGQEKESTMGNWRESGKGSMFGRGKSTEEDGTGTPQGNKSTACRWNNNSGWGKKEKEESNASGWWKESKHQGSSDGYRDGIQRDNNTGWGLSQETITDEDKVTQSTLEGSLAGGNAGAGDNVCGWSQVSEKVSGWETGMEGWNHESQHSIHSGGKFGVRSENSAADERRSGRFGPSGANTVPLGKRKGSGTNDWNQPVNEGTSSQFSRQGFQQDRRQWPGKRFNNGYAGTPRRDFASPSPQINRKPRLLKTLMSLPEYSEMDELYKAANRILHHSGYQAGDMLNPDDEKFILENILAHHREKDAKLGCGLDHIMIDCHADHQVSCFWVVRTDASKIDFSYWKCLEHLFDVKYPNVLKEAHEEESKDSFAIAPHESPQAKEGMEDLEAPIEQGAEEKSTQQEKDDGW